MKPIAFDNYLFFLENEIPYEGLIDVNGIMLRSVSDTVPVPPRHHTVANPPGRVNYNQSAVTLLTMNTLCYLPQDNKIDTGEILNKLTKQVIKYNSNGTVTVDFGNNNRKTFSTANSTITTTVSDNEYFLGETIPTFTISVKDNITGNYFENKMPLDDVPLAYGRDFDELKTSNDVGDAISFANSEIGNYLENFVGYGNFALGSWDLLNRAREALERVYINEARLDNIRNGTPSQRIPNVLGKIQKVGRLIGRTSFGFLGADVLMSGNVKLSHLINAGMITAGLKGGKIGVIIAISWFVIDYGAMGINYFILDNGAVGMGDMIDNWVGRPLINMYDGLY